MVRLSVLTIGVACGCLLLPGCSAAEKEAGDVVRRETSAKEISFVKGGVPAILVYRFAEVPRKPCVGELRTPAGIQVLRDSPADHKHHHALMFAVAVDGVDFWSETDACGSEAHRSFEGAGPASIVESLEWLAPDKRVLAKETRRIALSRGASTQATLVTWKTHIEPPGGRESIKIDGSHYFGLGLRFVESMDKGGKHFNSAGKEGEVVRGTERLARAAWSAYTAEVDGKPVTIALFDHPKNPRHPATMFTMTEPFAYLSATWNLHREPLEVKAGSPLQASWGVAAFDGLVDAAAIEALYRKWIALPEAGPTS